MRAMALQCSAGRHFRRHRGLSLVEMMITLGIGMLIITAMALLLANNSRARYETEKSSQKIENGRYAAEAITSELQNAGYMAELDPRALTAPTAKPDPCVTDLPSLRQALPVAVQGYNNVSASVLTCLSDVKAGTDILVVRRVSGCVAGSTNCASLATGDYAFQASSCSSSTELSSGVPANFYALSNVTTDLVRTKRDCATLADFRRYLVRIYYIGLNDRSGDGIPTLKRAELGPSGFTSVSLAQGIDDIRFEYGIDTNADGAPDVYTASPDLYMACSSASSPTCVGYWQSVVSVKLFALSRNIDPTGGYTDSKVYTLGLKPDGTNGVSGSANQVGPFGDGYKRSVFQEVVRLNNISGRGSTS